MEDPRNEPDRYELLPMQADPAPLSLAQVNRVRPRTSCKQQNNPFGHNPECPCGWARHEQ